VDAYLAIASKRDTRGYSDAPLAGDVRQRILDAGRLAGSSRNTQRRQFVVPSAEEQRRLAETVYAPANVRSAAFVVAIVGAASGFDVGRCAENMMLAAWNDGVASCPNGVRDAEAAGEICGGEVKTILSFGYPARPRDPQRRSADEWSARANRRPLDELVDER
jgi:nitroreductase